MKKIILLMLLLSYTFANDGLVFKNRETVMKLLKNSDVIFQELDKVYRDDRELALLALEKEAYTFEYFNDDFKKDKEFVTKAVTQYGHLLKFADSSFTKDRKLVLLALESSGYGLQYLDDNDRDNKELVLQVIGKNSNAIKYASPRLRSDADVALALFQQVMHESQDEECEEEEYSEEHNMSKEDTVLDYINPSLFNNKAFVMELLEAIPLSLVYISDALKNDKDIKALLLEQEGTEREEANEQNLSLLGREEALAKLKETPWIFDRLNKNLQKEKEFASIVIKDSPYMLREIDETLQQDRDFIVALLKEDSFLLEYVDEKFKNDKDLVLPMVYKGATLIDYMGKKLKKNRKLMHEVFMKTGKGFEYLSVEDRGDKALIEKALKCDDYLFEYVDEKLKDDKLYVLGLLKEHDIYENISDRLKKDREVVLASLKEGGYSRIDNVDRALLKDETFIEEAIKLSGYGFKYATKEQQQDRTLIKKAITFNTDVLSYVDESLLEDRAFIKSLMAIKSDVLFSLDNNLSRDKELVEFALSESSCSLCSVDSTLKEDSAFMLHLVKSIGVGFDYLTKEQKSDKNLILEMLDVRGYAYFDLNETQQKNRIYIEKALESNGWVLDDLPEKLQRDRALITIALRQNGWVIRSVVKPLNRDRALIRVALKRNGLALEFIDKDLRKDREFVLTALRENPKALTFVDNNLSQDRALMIEAITSPELFKYMDKSLLQDKVFMQKLKEITGFSPKMKTIRNESIVYHQTMIEVNGSLSKEKNYKHYEDYYIHKSNWNHAVDITANEKYIVSSNGSKIDIWDLNRSLLFKQIDTPNYINKVALIDRDKSILVLSNKEMKLFNLESGVLKNNSYTIEKDIFIMTLSPNKKWLVLLDVEGAIYIYNIKSGELVQHFEIEKSNSIHIAIDDSGKYIATGTFFSKEIRLWDTLSGKKITTFNGHHGDIYSLIFTSNQKYLISADEDGYIQIWDVDAQKLLRTLISKEIIKDMDVSSDGKWLLTSSNELTIWNLKTGKLFKTIHLFGKDEPWDISTKAKFIDNNQKVLVYGHDNRIEIIELNSSKILRELETFKTTPHNLSFTPDNKFLIAGGGKRNKVAIWDRENHKLLKVIESDSHHFITSMAISNDSKYLFLAYGWGVGGGNNIYIQMWDIKKSKMVKEFKNLKHKDRQNIYALSVSPNAKYLLSNLGEDKIELWSVEKGELIDIFSDIESDLYASIVFSKDSRMFITGDKTGKLYLWDVVQKKLLDSYQLSNEPITDISSFGEDKILVSSGKNVYLKNFKEHKNIQIFKAKEDLVMQVIGSKGGEIFITESGSSFASTFVDVWSIHQKTPLASVNFKHKYDLGDVEMALLNNGKEIAIGYEDGAVKLYATDNLKEPKKIFILGNKKNWVVFDEVSKKMNIADERNFLLKKHQIYKDENVSVFGFKKPYLY